MIKIPEGESAGMLAVVFGLGILLGMLLPYAYPAAGVLSALCFGGGFLAGGIYLLMKGNRNV